MRRRVRASYRARAAVQAELAKLRLRPVAPVVPIAADGLRREREAVATQGGIAPTTADKVATDEHTWQLFVEEQGLELDSYSSEETVVEFAVICAVKTEVQYCTPFLC